MPGDESVETAPQEETLRVTQTFVHADDSRITGKITVDLEGRGDAEYADLHRAAHDIVTAAREEYADD